MNTSDWTLKGGAKAVIRPIRPEDEALLVKFHQTLSDRTVYLRYFCSLSLATRTQHQRLVRICFADPDHETVLVAAYADPLTKQESIVGVGRLNKLPNGTTAEIAVLVSDDYQGQGLGPELVRRLLQAARDQRITRLVAEMLRDNIAMQKVLKKQGFSIRSSRDLRIVLAIREL